MADNELGYTLSASATTTAISPTVVGTNLRIDLREPLPPGESIEFAIDFAFNIVDENAVIARGGYEHFPDDEREGGNDIFLLAQWFPRLHAYTDYEGWTNKEFLGRGEFTLEFGDYTSTSPCPTTTSSPPPACCRTREEVLTDKQRKRLERHATPTSRCSSSRRGSPRERARGCDPQKKPGASGRERARLRLGHPASSSGTPMGYQQGGDVQPLVMAMSFYPKEASRCGPSTRPLP
jgi:hypothetical protein